MIELWRKQLSLKQLSLEHNKPITFIVSQWQKDPKPSTIYLLYRWLMAVFFLITFILSIVDLKHPNSTDAFRAKWLIYLTNWGFTICTLQAVMAAALLSMNVLSVRHPSQFYKAYWISNVIGTDIAFGITCLYWSLIYDEITMEFDAMNFLVHANNSILMMVDLFVVSHPVNLLHCCYSLVFGILYAMFSAIFYAAGGTSKKGDVYIYKILDWRKPGFTIAICFAVLFFIVIIHIVTWSLHKLRIHIHSKCYVDGEQRGFGKVCQPSKTVYVNDGMANDVV